MLVGPTSRTVTVRFGRGCTALRATTTPAAVTAAIPTAATAPAVVPITPMR